MFINSWYIVPMFYVYVLICTTGFQGWIAKPAYLNPGGYLYLYD